MAAVITTFPILFALGLTNTLHLYIVNLPVLVFIHKPLTISLVLRAAPGRRVNNTSSILQRIESSWERLLTVAKLRSKSRCPHSGLCTLSFSCLRVQESLILLPFRSAGSVKCGAGRSWEGWGEDCSRRGRELWGCFSPDVAGEEWRLLLADHPLPHSQLPAHRLFLFCCELQFPWALH